MAAGAGEAPGAAVRTRRFLRIGQSSVWQSGRKVQSGRTESTRPCDDRWFAVCQRPFGPRSPRTSPPLSRRCWCRGPLFRRLGSQAATRVVRRAEGCVSIDHGKHMMAVVLTDRIPIAGRNRRVLRIASAPAAAEHRSVLVALAAAGPESSRLPHRKGAGGMSARLRGRAELSMVHERRTAL